MTMMGPIIVLEGKGCEVKHEALYGSLDRSGDSPRLRRAPGPYQDVKVMHVWGYSWEVLQRLYSP